MKIQLDNVSVSESGDYYQVLFHGEQDGEEVYVLVQRQFESPDLGGCYIETHDTNYVGHFKVVRAELRRNRLFLRLARDRGAELEVMFNTTDENYQEVARVMGIMIPRLKLVAARDAC